MRLGVNVDHVATLRQARKSTLISPIEAAKICLLNGADGIVVHLREDRRHIQDKDVFRLRKVIRSHLNLEMSINKDIVDIATRLRPDVSTLVPERRQELTTEGGLDVASNESKIKNVVKRLKSCGINVSLFIDPVKKQIKAAKRVGADTIELHTGKYAEAKNHKLRRQLLKDLKLKTNFARQLGLCVAAGHGLDYSNTADVVAIKGIEELNIGYSIICRAVFFGLGTAVRQMRKLMDRA
ncbi:MAG: pyridoxine 5'-phosphate synthase [Candidatus Omnitrophota bacterium]